MTTVKDEYFEVVGMLETLARHPQLRIQQLEASVYFDDILLRLKLWAAEIRLDQGSLDWAGRIQSISKRLRGQLQRLKRYLNSVETAIESLGIGASDISATNDDILQKFDLRRSLTQVVDDLVDLATEIKTADLLPDSSRTSVENDRINENIVHSGPTVPERMAGTASYFIAAAFNLPVPPRGPLRLGSVLTNPSEPRNAINEGAEIPPASGVTSDFKHQVWISQQTATLATTGLLKHFVSSLALANRGNRALERVCQFDRLETIRFVPTAQYLAAVMEQPTVKKYLMAGFLSRRSIYIVTGLKIARGAAVIHTRTVQPASNPLDDTAGTEYQSTTTSVQTSDGSTDFIVAWSLTSIRTRRGRSTPRSAQVIPVAERSFEDCTCSN